MDYQTKYTEQKTAFHHMYDEAERRNKANKIISVLTDYLGNSSSLSLLDLSCSTGFMIAEFSKFFGRVVGLDLDINAIQFAKKKHLIANVEFICGDGLNTGFVQESFDVVICNQMYEHVPDAHLLLEEVYRILKPGGVCYFGATNRLKVIETHYGRLPFLSFMPKTLANWYLRILHRGNNYYETLYSYWGLKALCRKFRCIDYTLRIVQDPARFAATDVVKPGTVKQKVALLLLRSMYWLFPGYVWLLHKPFKTQRDAGQ